MKRIVTLAVLLLTTITLSAQSGKSIYQKYSGAQNISTVYISPAMFRIIGKIPEFKAGYNDVDLSPIIRSLTGLYLINSENTEINARLQADVNSFIASGKFELLMEANDSDQNIRMYSMGNEKIVHSFVMLAVDGNETIFICIDGQMDRDQLEHILVEEMKNIK